MNFWDFVRERHAIYLKRQAGAPPPWTTDAVLANYHFTNVYRELDPGTAFIREQLLAHQDMGLHERSFTEMGWQQISTFSGEGWARKLHQVKEPFHGAFYIHNLGLSIPKADAMGMVADYLVRHIYDVGLHVGSRRGFVENLCAAKGIGVFIATQVLADLCYDGHVPLPEDGWVGLGPGALKGLSLVAGAPVEGSAAEAVLEDLWTSQPDLPGGVRLTRMNLQNCACEYSKFLGHPRRRFHAEERTRNQGELLL